MFVSLCCILRPNLVALSCIWILDAWLINTEIPGMTVLFLEYEMSHSMTFHCKALASSHLRTGQYLWFKPQVGKNFTVCWQFFMGYLLTPPPQSKHQNRYLTPCCGLEVQNATQALKSVKSPGNTFDLSPKWARTLPSVGKFHGICIEPPKKNIQI